MTVPDAIPEKHQRIAEIVKKKYGLHVEKYTNRKKVVREVGRPFFDLINEAYAELFEFTKLTDRQIDYYVKIYLRLLRLDLLCVIKTPTTRLSVWAWLCRRCRGRCRSRMDECCRSDGGI